MRILPKIIMFALACGALPASADGLFMQVQDDYRAHYGVDQLTQRGLLVGVGGIMANTDIDTATRGYVREETFEQEQDVVEGVNRYGDFAQLKFALPVYLGAAWLHHAGRRDDALGPFGQWGNRSLRAVLLGTPEFILLARTTGAGRPTEGSSEWRAFEDSNGVSGHAFFGAIPLLTAAHMTGQRWKRYGLVAASTLPALARVESDKHYASQAVLGWGLAYLVTRTVARGEPERRRLFVVEPADFGNGAMGLQLRASW